DRYLCTPSGSSLATIEAADLVIADSQGHKVAGIGKVTSEFFTHLAAYEERSDVFAVVHAHPPRAVALTVAGISLAEPLLPEVVGSLGGIPTAPYATPATQEGATSIRPLIRKCDAVLLDRHGAVTVGVDVWDALHKMEKVEHAAETVVWAHLLCTPSPLNEEQLVRLKRVREAYGAAGRWYDPRKE
ncbi:MAG: class II aldolase/adducin family protein, partial [Candidatus Hydrogenedentales bacterium]